MRYRVQLWRTVASKNPELDRIARAVSVDDAIASLMKTFDWSYACQALALPADKDLKDASPVNRRRGVRCSISGKISYIKDGEGSDQQQSFTTDSLWTLL